MLLAGFSLQDVSGAALNPTPLLVHIIALGAGAVPWGSALPLGPKSLISLSWPTAER